MNGWAILNGARNGARIPNAAGATGRVSRPVKYGGDNGKPWPARSARPPPTG